MESTVSKTKEIEPIRWDAATETVWLIEQRLLPYEFKYVEIKTHQEMALAIKDMVVRGAPAIGISAAFGMVLAIKNFTGGDFATYIKEADELLRNTRPTAVNLMWALDEIQACIQSSSQEDLYQNVLEKAKFILADDIDRCKSMGTVGADYIKEKFQAKISRGEKLRIMTHCNAGALATGGYGTALGVIRKLHEENLVEMVYSDETRPRQQGSRLTVWELAHDHIPVTMNTDNMAAHLMQQGLIDLVVVGTDRVAANGDCANKIGTYQLAITANYHKIPFFVAAPMSSVDKNIASGKDIPIEERDHQEVSHVNGVSCTAEANQDLGKIKFCNPGFDVTPNELIEAIFTENGLI